MRRSCIALLLMCVCSPVLAQDHSTFESYRNDVEGKGCAKAELADATMFQCDKETTFYYFTKPNNPAHPGVVERVLKEEGGGFYISENGRSFAPDAAQPAFKAWLDQFRQLDDQIRQDIARQQGKQPAKP